MIGRPQKAVSCGRLLSGNYFTGLVSPLQQSHFGSGERFFGAA